MNGCPLTASVLMKGDLFFQAFVKLVHFANDYFFDILSEWAMLEDGCEILHGITCFIATFK
jgi:hypothetical protein